MNWRMRYGRNWGLLDMKYNVNIKKLSEVADLTVGFVGSMAKHYVDEGVPFLRSTNIRRFKIDMSDIKYISPEFNEKIKKSQLREGDVVIVRTGMPGACTVILKEQEGWNCSDLVIIHPHKEKVLPLYIAAYVNYSTGIINANLIGAVQQHFNVGSAKNMEIAVPSIEIQKKIVGIIQNINEKMDINSMINKNLEQQADAIYQSFFSPKSGIQGKRVTLDEYCSIFTGKKNANASVDGGKYKFFTCAPDALQIDSYIYDGNAIIISGNGAYTGRTRFYSGRFDLYQRTYACTLLDGINPDYIFPLYWFVKLELSKKIMGGTRGSAIPYIVMNDLAKFEFIYSDEMFDTYVPIFKSLTESIHVNELENEHLSNLRDTLLPQLMSGELDVSDINL